MLDLTDIPTIVCSCGCREFRTAVSFDPETNRPAAWLQHGYCNAKGCGNKVSFPEPVYDE